MNTIRVAARLKTARNRGATKSTVARAVAALALAACAHARGPLLDAANPLWSAPAPARYRLAFETTRGTFVVAVDRALAPLGADRLYALAKSGYFDDSRFFRVRAGFIAQFGIAGRPQIAQAFRDRRIPDDPVRGSNARGTVAFAMTGPGARTTQLFVSLKDNAALDVQGFAPVGAVVQGLEVVDALYAGYGESAGGGMRGGRQERLFTEGNAWLDREFPRLDHLLRATVLPP